MLSAFAARACHSGLPSETAKTTEMTPAKTPHIAVPRTLKTTSRADLYPDVFNRYVVAKLRMAISRTRPLLLSGSLPDDIESTSAILGGASGKRQMQQSAALTSEAQPKLKRCRFSFSEKMIWPEPLRGAIPLTDKEAADNLSIGVFATVRRASADFTKSRSSVPS